MALLNRERESSTILRWWRWGRVTSNTVWCGPHTGTSPARRRARPFPTSDASGRCPGLPGVDGVTGSSGQHSRLVLGLRWHDADHPCVRNQLPHLLVCVNDDAQLDAGESCQLLVLGTIRTSNRPWNRHAWCSGRRYSRREAACSRLLSLRADSYRKSRPCEIAALGSPFIAFFTPLEARRTGPLSQRATRAPSRPALRPQARTEPPPPT
jgi:hypothetical protein